MTVENGSTPESPPVEVSSPVAAALPTAAVESTDAVPAEPSPAKDVSLLDSVKAALKPKPEGSSPSQASQDVKPGAEVPSEDENAEPEGDPTPEELARYHSRTRKRMAKLMGERNEARDEVEKLRPEADVGRRITSFISQSGMTSDEANLLLEVGRNMKRDPLKALEQLKPYYDALTRMSGDVLPTDLQQAVAKGEITEPYARQLARGRTETTVLSRRTQAQEAEDNERRAVEQNQRHASVVSEAISGWEANQAKTDLDWNLKQPRIMELVELEVRRSGFPKTVQAALEMTEKARAKVTADMAQFAPRKQPVTPLNPASAARVGAVKPNSALEAARLAIAG